MKRALVAFVCLGLAGVVSATVAPPAPCGPVPSERQLRWHRMEFYGFVHFTVNTFTDKEWGYGDESPELFDPSALDAGQWVRTASDAGMAGLILTAKHHDGFCLWPSAYTEHSVQHAPWRDGEGDVVRELSDACRAAGLYFGVYLSPWDRNHPGYGAPEYVTSYRNQLTELLTNYGEVFEVWHDGANGGDGFYGGAREKRTIDRATYYGWPDTWALVRRMQPDAVIFSDAGPDIRWIGNERGTAPDPSWARIRPEGFQPGVADTGRLAHGEPDGTVWRPAEVDVSIRPGWFYHPDQHPKSVAQLLDIYYASVGRGACLLLNIPPDRRGLIPDEDVERLRALGAVLRRTFEHDLARGRPVHASNVRGGASEYAAARLTDGDRDTYWAADDAVHAVTLVLDFEGPTRFDVVRLEEAIRLGQRIAGFAVDVREDGQWKNVAEGKTIGARRILRLPECRADRLRVRITESLACPTLTTLEVYSSTPESATRAYLPTSAYRVEEIEGFTVCTSPELAEHPRAASEATAELSHQLAAIARVMPASPLARLRGVCLWLEWRAKANGAAEFHPSADWLRGHGYNPEKAGGIEINNARNFVAWSRQDQPWMVLHELAHAWHRLVPDATKTAIREAYAAAKAGGKYEAVLDAHGKRRRAYAMNNAQEYFAELSEAYFGRNDFEPFDCGELETFDPQGYRLMESTWGAPRDPL